MIPEDERISIIMYAEFIAAVH